MKRNRMVRVKGVVGKVYGSIAFDTKGEMKFNGPPAEATKKRGFGYLETRNGSIAVEWNPIQKQWFPSSETRLQEGFEFELWNWDTYGIGQPDNFRFRLELE